MRFGLYSLLGFILIWGGSIVLYSHILPSHEENHLINKFKGGPKPNAQSQLQNSNRNKPLQPSISLPSAGPPSRKALPWTTAPHIAAPPPIAPPQPDSASVEDPSSHPSNDAVSSGHSGKLGEDHHLVQHALPIPGVNAGDSPAGNAASAAAASDSPQHHAAPPAAAPHPPAPANAASSAQSPAAVQAPVVVDAGAPAAPSDNFQPQTTAVVVLTCKRAHYLQQTMEELLKLPGVEQYQVFVSQDGHDDKVQRYGQDLAAKHPFVRYINNDMRKDHRGKGDQASMFFIADHYKFVMTTVFERMEGITHAILLEEDIIVSPDFLRFFASAAPVLDQDPTLYCISSWNDNGYKHLDLDPTRLMRSRFFPGLGWMLRRGLWRDELRDKWPLSAWDHWMRTSSQHKGRDCIIPELSRNHNIGAQGATTSQSSFETKLKNVAHNTDPAVQFGDLHYLLRDNYMAMMQKLLSDAAPLASVSAGLQRGRVFRVGYVREAWAKMAEALGIYASNWPRGAFEHVNLLHKAGATLLLFDRRQSSLAPPSDRIAAPATLSALPAPQGVNCDQLCSSKNLRCDRSWFDFINDCEFLTRNFQCQRGCGYEVGEDIPNFVSDPKHPMHGFCLITDAIPTCHNKHPSTSRLCPCA